MSLTWEKSLLFWTAHGTICAAPSFIWAFMHQHDTPAAISAMLTGVVILILIYTWLSVNTRISVDKRHGLLASSIRWAAHLRASYALLSLLSLFPMILLRIFPTIFSLRYYVDLKHSGYITILSLISFVDFWTGFFAKGLVDLFVSRPPPRDVGFDPGFFPTLLDTLVTGVLFSVIFVFIVIVVRSVIMVSMRMRKAV